ncbi:MAG: hypothetical protein HY898_11540 [Deltaproteobacteria bacterium]|nr:hypothetical protein [Deltaproteobacteria bacterium]
MKVAITSRTQGFEYSIELEAHDAPGGVRKPENPAASGATLVGNRWQVQLPDSFHGLHPDLHAAAILYVLLPFVGRRLELPFSVSRGFADAIEARWRISLVRVDDAIAMRAAPSNPRPCLLYSGGADSVAISMLVPPDAVLLFLDRIARTDIAPQDPEARIDLREQRRVCDHARALGRDVLEVRDDHEALVRPYPCWHSEMSALPALYLADSLGLQVLDSGDVLCGACFGGYHDGTRQEWRFMSLDWAISLVTRWQAGDRLPDELPVQYALPMAAGLRRMASGLGLSQVATSAIVSRSAMRGRAFSCYRKTDEPYCLRCDKCFMKLLLAHVVEGQEVSAELFESFLRQPHLASIFARPVFDWHHIWVYLFQKMRCEHPFAKRMRDQAQRAPDLSLLDRWYPKAEPLIPEAYRSSCKQEIARYVPTMSPEDVALLERLQVPAMR